MSETGSHVLCVEDFTLLVSFSSCGLLGLVIVQVGFLVVTFGAECGGGADSGVGEGCVMP